MNRACPSEREARSGVSSRNCRVIKSVFKLTIQCECDRVSFCERPDHSYRHRTFRLRDHLFCCSEPFVFALGHRIVYGHSFVCIEPFRPPDPLHTGSRHGTMQWQEEEPLWRLGSYGFYGGGAGAPAEFVLVFFLADKRCFRPRPAPRIERFIVVALK